jgi:hypothetical protein
MGVHDVIPGVATDAEVAHLFGAGIVCHVEGREKYNDPA